LHGGIVLERHWLSEQQFIDAVAVAMITPGPVVITVGFIGYIVHGWSGAVAAALGVFLPVYLVVVIAGPFYKKFAGNPQLRLCARRHGCGYGSDRGRHYRSGTAICNGYTDDTHWSHISSAAFQMEDS
ncbi:MAG TPA: chromate transporter, partial [Blattabacteriaceae bacterium]|nr:chromate transporter [Blattabacteriaceae bacterium]